MADDAPCCPTCGREPVWTRWKRTTDDGSMRLDDVVELGCRRHGTVLAPDAASALLAWRDRARVEAVR